MIVTECCQRCYIVFTIQRYRREYCWSWVDVVDVSRYFFFVDAAAETKNNVS
jgi:hypothetical protein